MSRLLLLMQDTRNRDLLMQRLFPHDCSRQYSAASLGNRELFGASPYTDSMDRKMQRTLTSNSLTTTPATVPQRRIAVVTSGLLTLLVLLTLPFARSMFAHVPAFIAMYCSLAFFADLITAYLLFGQCFRTRSPSLLALAATYLYSSLIVIPYVLSFPDLFSATGLLPVGTQTASWLWIFWHIGFPLGILCYVLLDKKYGAFQATSHHIHLQFTLVLCLLPLVIILLSIGAIESDRFLPAMIVGGDYTRLITSGVGPAIILINLCAWVATIPLARRGTVMHIWLSVAALASLLEVTLILWASNRYTLGWYLGRMNTVVTATVVLCALLFQVNRLYERIVEQVEELFSLKETNRVRDQFLSTMSHELRTPLASIIGFSQMLVEDAAQGGWSRLQRDNLERILKNGQHLLGLINDVLDLSKIEAGQMAVPISQVDVRELLTSVVEETQSMALARHLVLRADVEEGVVSLESNPLKLRQVLLNLVSNALKFTEQGEVTVSARRVLPSGQQADQVAIAVKDSGVGIPSAIQEQIFDPFYQADDGYTRKFGGTGLGLSIARQLTTLLGGTIAVTSAPGKGSTFTVTLPIQAVHHDVEHTPPRLHPAQRETPVAPALLHEPGAKTAEREATRGRSNVVLAVDDNPDTIVLIKEAFKDTSYRVIGVLDPLQVMERIQEVQPCAITLDVMMPGFNGWQLLHQLKNNPATASIPVIMVTVLSDPATGYVLGADDYLIKPFQKHALVNTLDRLVTSRQPAFQASKEKARPV